MDIGALTLSARHLAESVLTGITWPEPLAFVVLDPALQRLGATQMPPWPVVGRGDRSHAAASMMDTIVSSDADARSIAEGVINSPLAAATLVQLLRAMPSLSMDEGLTVESMAYAMLQGSAAHRHWIACRPSAQGNAPGRVTLSREGDEVYVVLDRPGAGNAIDRLMRDALHEAFTLVNMDPTIRRITLRAHGKAFSLGAELSEFGTTSDPATAHMIRCRTLPAREAARCADRFAVEIDGACVGAGLELAAFASHITATRRSWFQLPELAMGIIPGAGGCVSVTRRIGRQRAALMVLSGRRIGARQALDWGLVDALVD